MNNENQTPIRDKTPHIETVIACLALGLFMTYSIFPSTVYAYGVIAAFLALAYRINKKGFTVTAVLTVLSFVLFTAVTLASLLAIISVAVIGGIMLTKPKARIVFIAIAAVVYAVAAVVTSPVEGLGVLTALPMAIALAVCIKVKPTRTTSVCAISGAFVATLVLPFAISFYITHGGEWLEQLKITVDELRTVLAEETYTAFTEAFSNTTLSEFNLSDTITPEIATSAVNLVFDLLPAIIIIISNLVAYVVHAFSLIARRHLGDLPKLHEILFSMSKVSAWVFIISFVGMLVSFSDAEPARVASMALQNINLILTPSFLLVGLTSFSISIRTENNKKKILHTVLAVLAFLYCGTFLIYPLVAFGVFNTLAPARNKQNTPDA